MQITDVSPTNTNNTTITDAGQSMMGRALCIACSPDGSRCYLGGHSGVWRSDNAGASWHHLEWAQPPSGSNVVPGCLPVPTIFDVAVCPTNPDLVVAAAGHDAHVPSLSGVYRSADGGATWARTHTFQRTTNIGTASTLSFAPDNSQLIYAAGQFAVAFSNDGGVTWTESPAPQGQNFWHVVVARAEGAQRRVFAVGGAGVWYSTDGGAHWSPRASGPGLGMPTDALGVSCRAVSINPLTPAVIYILDGSRQLWKGDYTAFASTGVGQWTVLPAIPRGPNRTPSGGAYVLAHTAPSGQLTLIAGDMERVYLSLGEPGDASAWSWIDQSHHADPHGMAVSSDFERGASASSARGKAFAINDGGVYVSSDGARTWTHNATGLSTLTVVNAGVVARPGKAPGLCIGTTDNSGFFSPDGGATWKTQRYVQGDNDCSFADPAQSNWLMVFAPRNGTGDLQLYTTSAGGIPDGAWGTADLHEVPGPSRVRTMPDSSTWGWNAVSWWYNLGYRPLVLTLSGQTPRPGGDFITIRFLPDQSLLLRSTALSQVTATTDWDTPASTEGSGVKVFSQGPPLPDINASVVQASGGHDAPVFYVSDPVGAVGGLQRLWKWTHGMSAWQLLVPGSQAPATAAPRVAQRFFVDPYRPNRIYILDESHVRRSEDGGATWSIETSLEQALTQNGTFPFAAVDDGSAQPVLLRDMNFDPDNSNYRFAVGPAGVFYTIDGATWDHLLLSSASAIQPSNSTYDKVSDFCNRSLYVATTNRGLLKLSPLPPDWDFPIGSLQEVSGHITFLRVNDVGTGYGPPNDFIDAEVIFQLDAQPEKAFGFQLRNDSNKLVNRNKLNLLRLAYKKNLPVLVDFIRTSCRNGTVNRVALR